MTLDEQKRAMRAQARARRAGAFRGTGPIGSKLASGFLAWSEKNLRTPIAISGYFPIGDEADVMPLLSGLASQGHRLCLPVTIGRGKPLEFRTWAPGDPLVPGPFDLSEPPFGAEVMMPDLMLVPLLAFDLAGGRLGYGAGFYDRSIAAMPGKPLKVGVGYDAQLADAVPMGPTDQFLDGILTENGLRWLAPAGAQATGFA